jgi:hypothetical protein
MSCNVSFDTRLVSSFTILMNDVIIKLNKCRIDLQRGYVRAIIAPRTLEGPRMPLPHSMRNASARRFLPFLIINYLPSKTTCGAL